MATDDDSAERILRLPLAERAGAIGEVITEIRSEIEGS